MARSEVLTMGAAIPAPDVPVLFGSGSVDDADTASGVWYNNNNPVEPGFFLHRFKWVPTAVDAPSYANLIARGGPPEIAIRMQITGESVGGVTGVSVLKNSGGGLLMVGTDDFVPEGVYATPTWFESIANTVGSSGDWDAWRTGNIRVSPVTASGATMQIYEVEITVSWLAGKAPPCRLTGRADNLGIGSGRIWPPPNTHQSSNRRGGGSTY